LCGATTARREELKRQRIQAQLAELTDADQIAAEDAALERAWGELQDAEANAAAARLTWQEARHVQVLRAERTKTARAELARASAAIRSTEQVREREQTERLAMQPT
jgi:hypothetical protein